MTDAAPQRRKNCATIFFATNGGLGFAPVAPGTFGTLAGIPAFYYLSLLPGLLQFVVIVAVITFSIYICQRAGSYFGEADTLFELGRWEEAIQAYRNAASRFLNRPESLGDPACDVRFSTS